jgi:hypothetical protein
VAQPPDQLMPVRTATLSESTGRRRPLPAAGSFFQSRAITGSYARRLVRRRMRQAEVSLFQSGVGPSKRKD